MKILLNFILFLITYEVLGKTLDSVNEDDLVHLIKSEDNVIVLFTKNNCNGCNNYETIVENLQDDFVEQLGATVVKAHNSAMIGIYDPSREPSLIFFRRGIPLLYVGEINEEEILHTFRDNKDPIVKELSDENFEHLTQASTGATTGDWLLFFYSNDCVSCQRLAATWEAVGSMLKRRLNIARLNRLESGISTAKRFNINKSPDFIYLRQGKFYRYKLTDYSSSAFIQFVEKTYKESKGESVPPISNSVHDFISMGLKFMFDRPYVIFFSVVGFGLTLITAIAVKLLGGKKKSTKSSSSSKKSKKTK